MISRVNIISGKAIVASINGAVEAERSTLNPSAGDLGC